MALKGGDYNISIHSLRMEGDWPVWTELCLKTNFNPLPPHGGRLAAIMYFVKGDTFQSTPSAWRETIRSRLQNSSYFISIHSLRMEGDVAVCTRFKLFCRISIHSLRMEGDTMKGGNYDDH